MSKEEKATLLILLTSLIFVMAIIFVGSEKQVSLSYKAGDVLDYPVININKINTKSKVKLSEAKKLVYKIILQDTIKDLSNNFTKNDNWNRYKESGCIKKKIEKWESYEHSKFADHIVEYIHPPYLRSYFKNLNNLYLVANYRPDGKLLSTKILYSPNKRLNSIAVEIIEKNSPIKIPKKLNKNIEIEFMFSERFCNPQSYLDKKLLETIKTGNIEKVNQLLKQGADINTYAEVYAGMDKAIDSGSLDMVKFLLNNEYDFSSVNEPEYLSAFDGDYEHAVDFGSFPIYKYLIDYAVKNNFVFNDEIIESLIKSRDIKKIKYFEPIKKPSIVFDEKIKVKKSNKQSTLLKDKRLSLAHKPMIDYIKSIQKKKSNLIDTFSTRSCHWKTPTENSIVARINKKGQVVYTKVIRSCSEDCDFSTQDKDAVEYIKRLSPFNTIPATYPKSFIDVQFDFTTYEGGSTFIDVDYYINKAFLKAVSDHKIKKAELLLSQGADINFEWWRNNAFQWSSFYNEVAKTQVKLTDFLFNNGYFFKPEDLEDIGNVFTYESYELVKYLTQKVIETGMDINAIPYDARGFYRVTKALNDLGYKYKIAYKNTYLQDFLNREITGFLREKINKPYALNKYMKSYYPNDSAKDICFGYLPDIFVFCFCLYPIESFDISLDFYKKNSKDWEIDKDSMFKILEYTIIALTDTNQPDEMPKAIDYYSDNYDSYREGKLSTKLTDKARIYSLQSFFGARGEFFDLLYLYYALKVLEFDRFNNHVAGRLYLKYGPKIQNKYNVYAINWNNGIIPEYPEITYNERDNFISHIDMPFAKSRYKTLPLLKMSFK